jgi:selenocysteine lyase/cysteine desulfurase
MSRPLGCQREAFAIPDGVAYLNAAYMGPLSHRVVDAGRTGLERKMRPWEITAPDFFSQVEAVRALFAQVIGADADGVAILPAVSYGVAVAANNLELPPGQRVVLLAEQFPSNVYSWHDLASRMQGDVVTVPRPDDHDWTSLVLDAIDERTAIVAVETCHWSDGGLVDLVRVGARAREVGAALVVDGTQSIGAMAFDVAAVQPDFVLTAVYKWLLAPYGAALMWAAPSRRDGRPLELSWITRRNSDQFAGLVDYESRLLPGARRYDVGQTSNFGMVPAVIAALEQTLSWGVGEVGAYAASLADLVAVGAEKLGLSVAPAALRAPHLLGVQLAGADPEHVAASMAAANVFVSVRGTAMRVSPHVYNDETDVERLIEALEAAL